MNAAIKTSKLGPILHNITFQHLKMMRNTWKRRFLRRLQFFIVRWCKQTELSNLENGTSKRSIRGTAKLWIDYGLVWHIWKRYHCPVYFLKREFHRREPQKNDSLLFLSQASALPQRQNFEQDTAPPYFALIVHHYLGEKRGSRWTGRGGLVAWPLRSPDLTACDLYLYGYIKNRVFSYDSTTIN